MKERYDIIQCVGRGGSGSVYQVIIEYNLQAQIRSKENLEEFAMKVIDKETIKTYIQ